jgi:integrase
MPNDKGRPMLLRDLLTQRYGPAKGLCSRSIGIYGHSIHLLEVFLGRPATVADLAEDTVIAFLRWREVTPYSKRGVPRPATIAKDRTQLLSLADYAFRKRLLDEAPVVKPLRVPKRLPRGFTADEIGRLIRACSRRQGAIAGVPAKAWWSSLIWAAWCTAARRGELLAVRWADVDAARCEIVFRAEGRKGHTRDICRRIDQRLAEQLEQRRGDPGALVWEWDRRPTSLYNSMAILCTMAAVPQLRLHAIRKASASYVAAGGGDAVEHLDHSDPAITRDHYLDDRIVGRRAGVDFLPPLNLEEEAEFIPDDPRDAA